jgi:hypothetical protein
MSVAWACTATTSHVVCMHSFDGGHCSVVVYSRLCVHMCHACVSHVSCHVVRVCIDHVCPTFVVTFFVLCVWHVSLSGCLFQLLLQDDELPRLRGQPPQPLGPQAREERARH